MYINSYGQIVYDDYLVHHGVMGMHWGIRRFQPYPSGYHGDGKFVGKKADIYKPSYATGSKTRLQNKAERVYAKAITSGSARATKKALNIISKQKARDVYKDRMLRKKRDYDASDGTETEAVQRNIRAADGAINELLRNAEISGLSVMSKKVTRDAVVGKKIASYVLAGIPGLALYSVANSVRSQGANKVEGEKFKVMKNSSDKEQQKATNDANDDAATKAELPSAAYGSKAEGKTVRTPESSAEYNRAKNEDKFQLSFLEATQNKAWTDNRNKMLSEYKVYLKDPEGYFKGRVHRGRKDNEETGRKLYSLSESKRQQAEASAKKQSVQSYDRVRTMRDSGMTYAQIADKLNVSESTVWAMLFDEE